MGVVLNEINDQKSKLILLGVALKLKRNLKEKIEDLKEISDLTKDEINSLNGDVGKDKSILIINKLLKIDEIDLINYITNILESEVEFDYVQTPKTEAEMIDYLLGIKDGSDVMDLYSGTGMIDEIFMKNHKNLKIDGYDVNNNLLEIAKNKMYLSNYENVKYYQKDVLIDNIEKKYQYAVADIPFISRYDADIQKSLENLCKGLKIELTGRISITWITIIKVLSSLKENGRAVITTMKGSLFNTLDREIRKEIIEKGYIEAIVDLPNNMSSYANPDISLIVLNKTRKNNKIKFVNLKECYIMNGKTKVINVKRAKQIIDKESIEVDLERIINSNYSLNYNAYIGNAEIKNGVELGKISQDIFRGYQITSSEVNKMLVENEEKMNYKILEISNINDEGEICSDLKMINSHEKNLDRYLLKDGDIVISARGDKVKKCLIKISQDEKIIANGSINVIRTKQNKLKPLYLKSFLDSEKGNISLNNIKSGVTIPSINIGDLQNMIVPCPSLKEQQKIVEKIEKKLEIIKSTTKRLEELKKELKSIADLI